MLTKTADSWGVVVLFDLRLTVFCIPNPNLVSLFEPIDRLVGCWRFPKIYFFPFCTYAWGESSTLKKGQCAMELPHFRWWGNAPLTICFCGAFLPGTLFLVLDCFGCVLVAHLMEKHAKRIQGSTTQLRSLILQVESVFGILPLHGLTSLGKTPTTNRLVQKARPDLDLGYKKLSI